MQPNMYCLLVPKMVSTVRHFTTFVAKVCAITAYFVTTSRPVHINTFQSLFQTKLNVTNVENIVCGMSSIHQITLYFP